MVLQLYEHLAVSHQDGIRKEALFSLLADVPCAHDKDVLFPQWIEWRRKHTQTYS